MSGQEHGRRSTNPSNNSGSHTNSLPSIRDVFPGAFDYAHGDPRARTPGHPASLPPLQHPVPPYAQPHAPAPYARGGPSSSMHSPPPPPPPMPRSNYYDPSLPPAPGLMPRAPAPLTPRPYSATRPYAEQRPPAMPMQTPPAPTMRPPQPPAAGAMPGGTFIKLGPSSSGGLVINAQSDNPRGLSKIGNLQFEPADPAEGRHVCDRCGRQFDRPSTLRTHMNAHDGNKPFACPRCGRGFGASSNMRRHERRCREGQGSTGTDPQSPSSVSSGSSRS